MTGVQPPEFLISSLSNLSSPSSSQYPRVTLTFAQSLDAKIAGVGGQQLILSGKESMVMTHWMRTMHDAILVGIGTALNDDPQLNTRHLPPLQDGKVHKLPQPVILDTHLRFSPSAKLLKNLAAGTGKQPWLVCAAESEDAGYTERKRVLEAAGARVLAVKNASASDYISISALLDVLSSEGINSLMVEGGARVIDSFLSNPHLVDTVIVTVAPIFVGPNSVSYRGGEQMPKMSYLRTEMFGKDAVVALKIKD